MQEVGSRSRSRGSSMSGCKRWAGRLVASAFCLLAAAITLSRSVSCRALHCPAPLPPRAPRGCPLPLLSPWQAVNCDESTGESYWLAQIRQDVYFDTALEAGVHVTWLEKQDLSSDYIPGTDDRVEAGAIICRVELEEDGLLPLRIS
jgi:hypothetical protein